jgi:hypothetical protein
MRAGIQNDPIFGYLPGFPFDFAQGGEPVEPRVSPTSLPVLDTWLGSPGMKVLLNCTRASY